MKNIKLLALLVLCVFGACAQGYHYETVKGDPYGVKIYTLQNGLKVYMSVYKDAPKIQTYIAVRVGSKNDPKETTGLAHYLEHLMFKGTPRIGTTNWQKEEPLLQQIEDMFEVYRSEMDEVKRKEIYHQIDSLSYLASGYAIPNEYGKVMKYIGSTGTNAWTSNDNTVYTEQIPSNQLENWAMIQADRFMYPVIRLFHTELETVYEEKNRSLTSDSRAARELMMSALFPQYPYGTQTTLGEAEHLKNPSIKNIRNFINTYYVPNNMAICLAGDFDPDEAVAIIEKYFGAWQSKEFPHLQPAQNPILNEPVSKTLTGLEAPFVNIAFHIGLPANHPDLYKLIMLDYLLNNGKTGLIDLNINQKQLAASASSYPLVLTDDAAFVLTGKPNTGQTLDDVKNLLLAQLDMIRDGQFEETLMQASLNNIRLSEMLQLESVTGRAQQMLNAFTNGVSWSEACHTVDTYGKITKQDVVDFVNRYFPKNGYIVVYKQQGQPEAVANVPKPSITPIQINRDEESEFFKQLKSRPVAEMAPVFVDFNKSIQHGSLYGTDIYSVQNIENQTFTLTWRIKNVGELCDRRWPIATALVPFLGTADMGMEDVRREFYRHACNLSVSCADDYIDISLSGLSSCFEPAFALMVDVLTSPTLDETSFKGMIANRIKKMNDAKSNQNSVMNALRSYGEYGPELVGYSLTPDEMEQLTAQEVLDLFRTLLEYSGEIYYYGPLVQKKLEKTLKTAAGAILNRAVHRDAQPKVFLNREVSENQVLFVPYDAKQSRLLTYSRGGLFDAGLLPIARMYNTYFGGGMNAIVFQEMREKRSLAYTAQSSYVFPACQHEYMYNFSFIGTQNDKVVDAWTAFNELFNEMPQSETAFNLGKETLKNTIVNTRYTKRNLLPYFISCRKLGFDYDYRRNIWDAIEGFTLQDVVDFNHKYIQNQPKTYMILAREEDVDFEEIEKKFGKVTKLSLKDIFGF